MNEQQSSSSRCPTNSDRINNLQARAGPNCIETLQDSSANKMEKIDIIGRINGEFGKWQLRTVLLIFLTKIPSAWFMVRYIIYSIIYCITHITITIFILLRALGMHYFHCSRTKRRRIFLSTIREFFRSSLRRKVSANARLQ